MTARKGWARQLVEVVEQRCCGRCRCLSPPPQPPPLASTPAAAAAASRLARSLLAPCRLHLSVQRDILKPVRSEARCAARASSTLVARWSWRWRWRRSFGSRVSVAWWTPHPAGNRLTSIWHAYSSACHTRHALPIVTSRWHLVADPIRALAAHTRSHGSLSLARPTPPHPFERSCTCPATLAQPACQLQHSTPRHTAAASSQQRPSPPAAAEQRGSGRGGSAKADIFGVGAKIAGGNSSVFRDRALVSQFRDFVIYRQVLVVRCCVSSLSPSHLSHHQTHQTHERRERVCVCCRVGVAEVVRVRHIVCTIVHCRGSLVLELISH